MINPTLTTADFRSIPPGHQTAFGAGTVRVVNLPRGFLMFKLTAGKAPAHATYGITPWWSPVKPFFEDYEGALGRYEQAVLNGIDLSAMVRFMSAVCIDWNDLDNFVQVELADDCRAFWGTFAPQPKFSGAQADPAAAAIQEYTVNRGADLPPDLGVLEAWQLYVPNLREADIRRRGMIPAHDMNALAIHFGLG